MWRRLQVIDVESGEQNCGGVGFSTFEQGGLEVSWLHLPGLVHAGEGYSARD